jgi:hypothetical protein
MKTKKIDKKTIFLRYEFSDEQGHPEGGDILEFSSIKKAQAMAEEILRVAHSDQVAVNLTIGRDKPFYGFLKTAGLSRKDLALEMVKLNSAEGKKK